MFRVLVILMFASFFYGCFNRENEFNPIEDVIANSDPHFPIVYNIINPGDCQTCVAAGKKYSEILANNFKIPDKNIIFIIPEIREIERVNFFNLRFPKIGAKNELNILYSSELSSKFVRKYIKEERFFSFVVIANYDSTLFCDFIKSPNFVIELSSVLNELDSD